MKHKTRPHFVFNLQHKVHNNSLTKCGFFDLYFHSKISKYVLFRVNLLIIGVCQSSMFKKSPGFKSGKLGE